jgi:V-type H+-transporting ATPase subunit a
MWGGTLNLPPTSQPYVFGIDPIWHGRKTELPYFNSLKVSAQARLCMVCV